MLVRYESENISEFVEQVPRRDSQRDIKSGGTVFRLISLIKIIILKDSGALSEFHFSFLLEFIDGQGECLDPIFFKGKLLIQHHILFL